MKCRLGGREAAVLREERGSQGCQGNSHKHRPSCYLSISESICGWGWGREQVSRHIRGRVLS